MGMSQTPYTSSFYEEIRFEKHPCCSNALLWQQPVCGRKTMANAHRFYLHRIRSSECFLGYWFQHKQGFRIHEASASVVPGYGVHMWSYVEDFLKIDVSWLAARGIICRRTKDCGRMGNNNCDFRQMGNSVHPPGIGRELFARVYSLMFAFLIQRAFVWVHMEWAGWKPSCCFQPRATPWV